MQAEQEKKASKGKKRRRRKNKGGNSGDINTDVLESAIAPPNKKAKIEHSKTQTTSNNVNDDGMSKSKKKRMKRKANQKATTEQNNKKSNKIDINKELLMSDKRLEQYGLKPNRIKRKMRKQKYAANASKNDS